MRSPLEVCAAALLAVALAGGAARPSSAQPPAASTGGVAERAAAQPELSAAQPEPSAAQSEPAAAQSEPSLVRRRPTAEEINQALSKVEADPNLAAFRTVRTLRWRRNAEERGGPPRWVLWLAGLFAWFAETGRLLVWVAVFLIAGLLGVYVVRLVRRRGGSGAAERFVAPSHVQDLDIRPESLPDDIGAAARELWGRGEQLGALALLYRGLLSRLAHVHGVPIRDSSTEGDCLALAAQHLTPERMGFAASLVGVWQVAVYGGVSPDSVQVFSLCDDFGSMLDPEHTQEQAEKRTQEQAEKHAQERVP